jgi:hypothetical protein
LEPLIEAAERAVCSYEASKIAEESKALKSWIGSSWRSLLYELELSFTSTIANIFSSSRYEW